MTFSHVTCLCIGAKFCVRTGALIMKKSWEMFYQGKQDAKGREINGFYKVTNTLYCFGYLSTVLTECFAKHHT